MMPFEERPAQEELLRPFLDHLAAGVRRPTEAWEGWQIARVAGGRNNLLYRATGAGGDLAVKFTLRDERDRAGREYAALSAIRQAGLTIAPEPILLDRTRYAQPVVVQTWIEGEVSAAPPKTDAEWESLLRHIALVHAIRPENTAMRLPEAVLNASSPDEARQKAQVQAACVPFEAQPDPLRALLGRLEAARFPEWPDAPAALCRNDNNISNFIRCPGLWASVDWEYSGWGDPAFDLAVLLTHPSYIGVSPSRWEWLIDAYCDQVDDTGAELRIRVYRQVHAVWWVARVVRALWEIPRGLDDRLTPWPDDWQADLAAKYEHYVRLAETLYA